MNNIVISTSLIAISILAAFLYIMPEYKELKEYRDNRTEYISSIETISAVQEKFDDAQEWRKVIRQDDLERIDAILPEEFNNVKFLLDLDTMASAHGIEVGAVNIEQPVDDRLFSTYNISFAFDAPYEGAAETFMSQLENNLVLFDVTSLKMENASEGLLGYALSFNTYAQK